MIGLLGVALIGVGPLLSFVLLLQFAVYASEFGLGPFVIALPATALQLLTTIVLARVIGELFGAAIHSRPRAILAALFSATITAVRASGWALVPTLDRLRESGFATPFSLALRTLPTGWGILAVEGARDGNWALALGALGGMVVLCGALLLAWATLLERQTIARGGRLRPGSGQALERVVPRRIAESALGAVMLRELRSWWRDVDGSAISPSPSFTD